VDSLTFNGYIVLIGFSVLLLFKYLCILGPIYKKSLRRTKEKLRKKSDLRKTYNEHAICMQRILGKTYDELMQNVRQQFISRKSFLYCFFNELQGLSA